MVWPFIVKHKWAVLILVFTTWFIYHDLSKPSPEEIVVYVTDTGTKYHRGGCSSLRASRYPLALKEASKYYSPCKNCNPPVLKQ
jgi:hypothetical protein